MPEPVTAYSYLRYSSPKQAAGDSIRRQTAARDAWLAAHPGVALDSELKMTDAGRSGFKRANWDTYALAAFVAHIKSGRVRPGSYLLVENLDRLSREDAGEATELFLSIVNRGIVIVQLSPAPLEFRRPVNTMSLMFAIVELSRGHSESAIKSERIRSSWGRKRTEAARTRAIATKRCPAWLTVEGGRFRFKPGARDTLRRIFRMAIDGTGAGLIAAQLAADNVPHFEAGHRWIAVYVHRILRSVAPSGRFQPMHRGAKGKREAIEGAAVEGYYPAAVSLADWQRAQDAVTNRREVRTGRPGKGGWVALYGPVFDARTGERMHATVRTAPKSGRRYYVLRPPLVTRRAGLCVSFPLSSFESAVRAKLAELSLDEVFPVEDEPARVSELREQLAEVELRRAKLESAMVEGDEDGAALPVLRALGERVRKLAAELARAQACQSGAARGELAALSAIERSAKVETDPATRLRYRACAARLIERVDVLVVAAVPTSLYRLAAVQVRFREGGAVRSYLVCHRCADRGPGASAPERWAALALPGQALDLRERAEAAQLETQLLALGPAKLC